MIVVLHDIRSSHNVGSIFRTADAAGVEKLYLCGITPCPLDRFKRENTHLTKVSLGAEHTVPWAHESSASALLARLSQEGFRIYAIEQDPRAIPYYQEKASTRFWKHCALVLGNEIGGIDPSLLSFADKILDIPMHGKKESLNVSVAFGIVLYHLLPKG